MKQFQHPEDFLSGLDPKTTGAVIAAAADVALILDDVGVVRDVAFGSNDLPSHGYAQWPGQSWLEIVTSESRPKVEALLRDASPQSVSPLRQVNHQSPKGADVPVLYSTVKIEGNGRVIAVGRDLRDVAALQQQLVEAQQWLERDYARARQLEMRYRLLFQLTSEVVLIVDPATGTVAEANPAAETLLGKAMKDMVGKRFPRGLDRQGMRSVESLMATVRSVGKADPVHARLADGTREFLVSASLFRHDRESNLLIRLCPVEENGKILVQDGTMSPLCPYVQSSADGFVVTDDSGYIVAANRAFLDMAQLVVETQAAGESLERWLGRPGVDLKVLITNLRERGLIRMFASNLHGEHGISANVEVSASSIIDKHQVCFVFAIRNVSQRLSSSPSAGRELPRSVEQLTSLVGGVPLKEIVRETTDIIERLCIEAALDLTSDNRASAADVLGLSRQSLYVKLRRFGLTNDTA